MKYKLTKNGGKHEYEISYSQQLQKKIADQLKINNILLIGTIILLAIAIIIMFYSGLARNIAETVVCQ